jgi:hypothetical protein
MPKHRVDLLRLSGERFDGTFVDSDLTQALFEEGFNLYPSLSLLPGIFVVQSRRMISITVSVVWSR